MGEHTNPSICKRLSMPGGPPIRCSFTEMLVDWSDYTTGMVTVDSVAGDHMEAVQSIQVHQRISEILSGLCR